MTMGNLLDVEHGSGLVVTGDGDWHAVCMAALSLPEIDAAGLDVCFDDGELAILVYAECTQPEWENGVAAVRALAGHFGFTVVDGDSADQAVRDVAAIVRQALTADCLFSAA